jgi:hypothetical protein
MFRLHFVTKMLSCILFLNIKLFCIYWRGNNSQQGFSKDAISTRRVSKDRAWSLSMVKGTKRKTMQIKALIENYEFVSQTSPKSMKVQLQENWMGCCSHLNWCVAFQTKEIDSSQVHEPCHSAELCIYRSINQSINQSINKSINQSINYYYYYYQLILQTFGFSD